MAMLNFFTILVARFQKGSGISCSINLPNLQFYFNIVIHKICQPCLVRMSDTPHYSGPKLVANEWFSLQF